MHMEKSDIMVLNAHKCRKVLQCKAIHEKSSALKRFVAIFLAAVFAVALPCEAFGADTDLLLNSCGNTNQDLTVDPSERKDGFLAISVREPKPA